MPDTNLQDQNEELRSTGSVVPGAGVRVETTWDDEYPVPASVDERQLKDSIQNAVQLTLAQRGVGRGEMGVRITGDVGIRDINQRHLGHDYATDVISFGYELEGDRVEGELVVSLETAIQQADRVGWPWMSELLLYVVHGTLHITGMEDSTPIERSEMRQCEQRALSGLGIQNVGQHHADRFEALDGLSESDRPTQPNQCSQLTSADYPVVDQDGQS